MAGLDAFGIVVERRGSDDEWEEIPNVTEVNPPSVERETIDVTAHDSPDGYMEYLGGLKDPGEVEIEANYDPSEHDSIREDFEDKEARSWRVTFPDDDKTQFEFKAFLTEFEVTGPYDDKSELTITLQVTGKPDDPTSSESDES